LPRIWRRDPLKAEQGLEDLRQLTRGALAEMRTMLLALRPVSLVKTPLADLLRQLVEAVTSRIELQPQLDIDPVPPLPPKVHINFYRVAQEALNNVVKHAGASEVSLSLRPTPPYDPQVENEWQGQLQLTICDDGQGFELTEILKESLGIGIIRERAGEINATVTIDSSAGKGTVVTLVWEKGES
jgi:signal transduction histidine kinase